MTIYYENIIVRLYILYALNTQVKICVKRMLFAISINLFFIHSFKLQKLAIKRLIDNIGIEF